MPAAIQPAPAVPEGQSGGAMLGPVPGPAGRDLRLDTLRGFMLVAIAINHLDTELRVFTDYVFGFVSTAEGFVFLSGLVAGLVYTRRSASLSPAELGQKARRRAGEIYFCHLAAFVTIFLGLHLLALFIHAEPYASPALFFQQPIAALLLGSSLLLQPGLLDILPMYCGFMLVLPLMLAALRKGHWGRLLALSGGLWLLAQFGLRDDLERWLQTFLPVNLGAFDLLAWQFLFVAGVFLGFHWAKSPKPLFSFRPAMLVFCLLVAAPLWFLINSRRAENDAEHSWHLCLIVITLAEHANSPQLDVLRVLKMLILHDLVEIDAGDTFAYDTKAMADQHEREACLL